MFYDRFAQLCTEKGVAPSKVAAEVGFDKSAVTQWKKRGLTPRGKTLSGIAAYFGVSVDTLLADTPLQTKTPSGRPEGEEHDARHQVVALLNRLSDEGAEKVLAMLLLMFPEDEANAPK